MAKKTPAEQAAIEIKRSLKELMEEVKRLQLQIIRRENNIVDLNNAIVNLQEEKRQLQEDFDNNFISIFGLKYKDYMKGYEFEKHVVWWMHQYFGQYELKIWQGDKFAHPYIEDDMICASWNMYPDLIYVDEQSKRVVTLECKYRNDGKLKFEHRQYENYKKFESQICSYMGVDARVYIMAGSRGETSHYPDFMYCIPIDYFADKDYVDYRDIPEYKVYERGFSNVIRDNIDF